MDIVSVSGLPEAYADVNRLLEREYGGCPVDGCDFYRYLFPDNENSGEMYTDYSHPNAVYLYRDEERDAGSMRRLRRRIMLNDTWESDYVRYVRGNQLALCGGLSFRGRRNRLKDAQRMHALIFDLDSVGGRELETLFLRFGFGPGVLRSLPLPTFIVSSGTGLHLYYVFDEPIDLYPNIKLQLKSLKYDLTFRIWDYRGTSQKRQIEYQSFSQSFRMVGSVNEKYGSNVVVAAYRTGDRIGIDELNRYVNGPENAVDLGRPFKPSRMTREEAEESYPGWYRRVVADEIKSRRRWDIKGKQGYALYNWWMNQIWKIEGGHRYFFMMCMAVYACKCDVPRKKLEKDMNGAFEILRRISHDNELTEYDVESAMKAYDRDYFNFTIDDIEKLTGVRIERNRRNGRTQKMHVKIMSSTRDILYPNGEWRNVNGRPKAEGRVREYMREHPEARKCDVIRETGLSKPTVYKYYDLIRRELKDDGGDG